MLDWLLNYAVHSTILLGVAWMLSSRTRSHLVKEALWKTALFGGFITATGQSLLAVKPLAGRMVVDKTGLTGYYTLVLQSASTEPLGAPPGSAATATELPSIFTAVQEQLGLKLVSSRAPVEVLVIDSVQRPTPD